MEKQIKKINEDLLKIRNLEQKAKSDAFAAAQKQRDLEQRAAAIRQAQMSVFEATSPVLALMILSEILDDARLHEAKIEVNQKFYKLEQLEELAKVAVERQELIRQAQREGIELSPAAKQAIEQDRIGFLLSERPDLFAGEDPRAKEIEEEIERIEVPQPAEEEVEVER